MSNINKSLKKEYKNVSKIMDRALDKKKDRKYPKLNGSVDMTLHKKKSKSDQRSSAHFKKWVRATDGEWDEHN